MRQIYISVSLFLSACLLFVIQPMVAKILLPVYGGTPAVWIVCLLFFQALVLVAYGYVWVLSQFSSVRMYRMIHLSLAFISLCVLPMGFIPLSDSGSPELSILKNLVCQLGLPLLVIGTSAPLLQFIFSQLPERDASDPYFLYGASNAGSLLALLSYPWLIERFLKIGTQWVGWDILYVVYIGLLVWILLSFPSKTLQKFSKIPTKIAFQRRLVWIFLSFIPCSLMLGVTLYITTDVAATPLFWVLPLALYLLSFVLTFMRKPFISHVVIVTYTLPLLILMSVCFLIPVNQIPVWVLIPIHLGGFFVLALLCHGELVRMRPDPTQLTSFYFCLAFGGVLAGVFNGLLAPRLFNHAYEYPVALWLSGFVVFRLKKIPLIFLGGIFLLFSLYCLMNKPVSILSQQRNFYGIKQVFSQLGAHVLMSQNTIHGFQVFNDTNPTDGARAYYGAVLPVVQKLQILHQPLHAMVVGLGTGVMACQFRTKDELSFVEIDEQVIQIASSANLFTYLRDCPSIMTIMKEDGRLAVAKVHDAALELLVIDAFSSDAIPVHLLTREAFALYQKKVTSDGIILVNISNRHLTLLPVITGAGRQLNQIVLHKVMPGNSHLGQLASEWALLTANEQIAINLMAHEGWHFVADREARLWTDDYSNLIPLMK